jgi:hypothetical protein
VLKTGLHKVLAAREPARFQGGDKSQTAADARTVNDVTTSDNTGTRRCKYAILPGPGPVTLKIPKIILIEIDKIIMYVFSGPRKNFNN